MLWLWLWLWLLGSLAGANDEAIQAEAELDFFSLARVGFGSCNDLDHTENMFGVLAGAHLDQLLLLGDNMYADTRNWLDMHVDASPQQIEIQYQKLFANKGE